MNREPTQTQIDYGCSVHIPRRHGRRRNRGAVRRVERAVFYCIAIVCAAGVFAWRFVWGR